MPELFLPTSGGRVDAALTQFSVAYTQDASEFVHTRVFGSVAVEHQTDFYYTWPLKTFLQAAGEQAVPFGVEAPGGGASLSTDNYRCEIRRWKTDITPDVRKNIPNQIELDRADVDYTTGALLIRNENIWAGKYFQSGVWAEDWTAVDTNPDPLLKQTVKWSNYTESDPAKDVSTLKLAIKRRTGKTPNVMTVSEEVHEILKRHPLVLARYVNSGGSITRAQLANYFEVERYEVAGGIQVTSPDGAETVTTDFVLGNHFLLTYAPARPDDRERGDDLRLEGPDQPERLRHLHRPDAAAAVGRRWLRTSHRAH